MTTTPIDNTSITTDFNVDELTEGTLTGKGVFDVLLQTLRLHLDREFNSNRITGTAYATVYSQAITAFLAQAAQYAISKAKLPLELQLLQEQINLTKEQQNKLIAETSLVGKQELQVIQETSNLVTTNTKLNIEKDKLSYELAFVLPEEVTLIKRNQDQVVAQTNKVTTDTVVTIKQGHLTDAQTCQVKAETNQVNAVVATKLPKEVAQIEAQTSLLSYDLTDIKPTEKNNLINTGLNITAQTSLLAYDLTNIKPVEKNNLVSTGLSINAQTAQNTAQTAQITYTTANLLPAQVTNTSAQTANMAAQTDLYAQKKVTELAQTTSTPAAGSVMGVQNALMAQQQENYLRDAEQKAAKIMIETWAVRQNTDGGQVVTTNHLGDTYIATAVDALLAGI